ncbi:MAG: hypothetical protein J7521_01820 [Caulobacter sp.]|nr:hypothetical protein [Caulobacter sp.]
MASLRLSVASNDNWVDETWAQRRYGAMPSQRKARGRRLRALRPGRHLLASLATVPLLVWGLWLLLAAPLPEEAPAPALPRAEPPVDQIVATPAGPHLKIQVVAPPPPRLSPEAWGALPTAPAAPVAATPLADPSTAPEEAPGCREASTLAAQMTCVDPVLSEAARRMAAAYQSVLAAGASPAALGRSQARWLPAREAAAARSPDDLLAAYQLREIQLRNTATALIGRAGAAGQPRAFTGAAPST